MVEGMVCMIFVSLIVFGNFVCIIIRIFFLLRVEYKFCKFEIEIFFNFCNFFLMLYCFFFFLVILDRNVFFNGEVMIGISFVKFKVVLVDKIYC